MKTAILRESDGTVQTIRVPVWNARLRHDGREFEQVGEQDGSRVYRALEPRTDGIVPRPVTLAQGDALCICGETVISTLRPADPWPAVLVYQGQAYRLHSPGLYAR